MTDFISPTQPRIVIAYCPGCKWLTRSAWMAQELLSTFEAELGEVALRPSGSGLFQIWLGEELLWCRKRDDGFPPIKALKQRVRDRVTPGRDLGHVDRG